MTKRVLIAGASAVWLLSTLVQQPMAAQERQAAAHAAVSFETSDSCLACHNGLTTPEGEDVSIGVSWRASMMANSSRDPYWQASVRRETIDHATSAKAIQDECATCHMPMARAAAHAAGREGEVLALLPSERGRSEEHRLAADGVSCTLCHQIGPDRLGTRESFNGGFALGSSENGYPGMFGPFDTDQGRTTIMRSAAGVRPAKAEHLRKSEVCATCHTLYTNALGPKARSSVPCRSRCRISSGAIAPSSRTAAVSPVICRRRRTRPSRRCSASRGNNWRDIRCSAATSSCCGC